jgi:hypothetical protein
MVQSFIQAGAYRWPFSLKDPCRKDARRRSGGKDGGSRRKRAPCDGHGRRHRACERGIVGGIDQVSQAIVGTDKVTQQNVAFVQQGAASAAAMRD